MHNISISEMCSKVSGSYKSRTEVLQSEIRVYTRRTDVLTCRHWTEADNISSMWSCQKVDSMNFNEQHFGAIWEWKKLSSLKMRNFSGARWWRECHRKTGSFKTSDAFSNTEAEATVTTNAMEDAKVYDYLDGLTTNTNVRYRSQGWDDLVHVAVLAEVQENTRG